MNVQLLCPHCDGIAKPLQVLNVVSITDYFQCQTCGRVSERAKGSDGDLLPLDDRAIEPPALPA